MKRGRESGIEVDVEGEKNQTEVPKLKMGKEGKKEAEQVDRIRFSLLKGYPPWPCEVIPKEKVKKVFPQVLQNPPGQSDVYLPVQYFGTMEFGWVKQSKTVGVKDFDEEKVRARNKKSKSYQKAVHQVYKFVSNPKIKPIGWWNGPAIVIEKVQKETNGGNKEAEVKPRKERNAPHKGVATRLGGVAWPKDRVLWCPHEPAPFRLPEMLEIRAKPKYETLRRNLYLGPDHGSHWKPKRLPKEDILVCMCKPGFGCGSSSIQEQETCINRRMYVRCYPGNCPNGKECKNKEFNQMKSPKLKAFLTQSCGWGVKTKEKISKGSFVIEYAGEILNDAECEKRMWKAKEVLEKNFYMMEISSDCVIDARHKANLSRLINSSCQPNCKSQKCTDASTGEVRVGIFAIRDIEAGEELSYNYQFQHFAHEMENANKTSFDCRCGAPNCIGTLDSTVEKREEIKKFMNKAIKIKWTDGKFHNAVICDYDWKTQKYIIEYESGGREALQLKQDGKIKFKFLKRPKTATSKAQQSEKLPLKPIKLEDNNLTTCITIPPLKKEETSK